MHIATYMYSLSGLYAHTCQSNHQYPCTYVSDIEELATYNYTALNATVSIVLTCFSFISGVPAMVPNVTVDDNITINGNIVTHLRLSWGEPLNNLDPIVNYTVSCSGDNVTCPPNFTTTDNTTRSYTITNLTTMTTYTFSVVATNSIGSGEAGVMMITTPGKLLTVQIRDILICTRFFAFVATCNSCNMGTGDLLDTYA